MTYNAKLPFAIYEKHFAVPKGVKEDELKPIKIIVQFVAVDNDLDKMNLHWRCKQFLKFGTLGQEKCDEIKKDIFKWITWYNKDSFTKEDLP